MLESEQKSKQNPLLYGSFYSHFWETYLFQDHVIINAIDIGTKQTKASIMGQFLYWTEANKFSPKFFIIEAKRTSLDHNIFSSSEANKISQ